MQKFSINFLQIEFSNTLKRLYTMIKFVSFQECKDGSTHTNP
jgi:hypothetical protein